MASQGHSARGVDIGADEFVDTDGDTLADAWEFECFGDLGHSSDTDADGDGATNLSEYLAGTDPSLTDTDGDGISDADETSKGTDPLNADTDGDGMSDGWEAANGLNPLDPNDGRRGITMETVRQRPLSTGAAPAWNDPASFPQANIFVSVGAPSAGDGSRERPFNNIAAAMSAVRDYGIVEVGPGIYKGDLNKGLRSNYSDKIIIRSEKGPDSTIIDGEGSSGNCFYFTCGGKYIYLKGFTIRNFADYCVNNGNGGFTVIDCVFKKNNTYCVLNSNNGISAIAKNCIFLDNKTGVACNSGASRFVNCTFLGNTSSYGYGAVYSSNNVELVNCVLWGNTPRQINGTATISYSCVQGGYAGEGNISTDPRLTRLGRLTSGSPCVDAGGAAAAPRIDIDGEPRPFGQGVDLGADEFVDTDGDTLPDTWELACFGDLDHGPGTDADGDGVTDVAEFLAGTDPSLTDTDGDGISDSDEISRGTDPLNADTDGDGIPDGWEVANGLDPLDPNDASEDQDDDGVPTIFEYRRGTAWNDPASVPQANKFVSAGAPAGGDGSKEKPFNSMSAAMSSARNCDIVEVGPGIYNGASNIGLRLYSCDKIIIRSEKGPATTIFDGEGSGNNCFYFSCAGKNIHLKGFTMRNFAGYCIQNGSGGFTVIDCVFKKNTAYYVLCSGGNVKVIAKNCLFLDNTTNSACNSGTSRFVNCTFLRNTSSYGYGAVYSRNDVELVNCVLWDNSPKQIDGTAAVSYSCVQGGYAGDGNISFDPQLTRDGRLTSGSPCVDAGGAAAAPKLDIDREPRPFGQGVDIGADEFVDTDGDTLPDAWELECFGDLGHGSNTDADGDGSTDLAEYLAGTNPLVTDTDADGLSDSAEATAGTDPLKPDTDGDGLSDGWETANSLNPLDPADGGEDHDGDGYPTCYEVLHGSDWQNPDSIPAANIFVSSSASSGGDGSRSKPFSNLQTALSAAKPFDIIQMAPGVYKGTGNRSLNLSGKKLIIQSEAGPGDTIVDCEKNDRFIYMSDCSRMMIVRGVQVVNAGQQHYYIYGGAPQIVDALFRHNKLSSCALILCYNGCSPTIKNCVFTNNTCASYRSLIECSSSSPLLVNCVFADNALSSDGYAARFSGGNSRIVNSVFLHNKRPQEQQYYNNPTLLVSSGTVSISNSILWDDTTTELYGNTFSVSFSCVKGGFAGTGNITSDPMATRGGHLLPGSPCLDAADPATATLTDIDCEGRPLGAGPDIGADEFSDSDGDGMDDGWEIACFGTLEQGAGDDPDHDGIDNYKEYLAGTNPSLSADHDGDGMYDDWEVYYGLSPFDPTDANGDLDKDGLTNLSEFKMGTNPTVSDTDGDGYSDAEERDSDSNPLDPNDLPGQFISISNSPLKIPEGGAASCEAVLSVAPTTQETISVSVNPEISNFKIESGLVLVIDQSNWSVPHAVSVSKAVGSGSTAECAELVFKGTNFGRVVVPLVEVRSKVAVRIASDQGGETAPAGELLLDQGQSVEVVATPRPGYEFSRWAGDVDEASGKTNPVTVVADAPKSLTALFERKASFRVRFIVGDAVSSWHPVPLPTLSAWRGAPSLQGSNVGSPVFFDDIEHVEAGQVAHSDGFEEGQAGAMPSGWSVRPEASICAVSDEDHASGAKSLRLAAEAGVEPGVCLQAVPADADAVLGFSIKLPPVNGKGRLATAWLLGAPLSFVSDESGRVSAVTFEQGTPEAGVRVLRGIDTGVWTRCSIQMDRFVDSDRDGIDDDWEILSFGDLSQRGDGDFDNDGRSNLEEYLGETNPTTPDPRIKFASDASSATVGSGALHIPVSLSCVSSRNVRAVVAALSGTAVEGRDYELAAPCVVVFTPGETLKTIQINIKGASLPGGASKCVLLGIQNPLGASPALPVKHLVTIAESPSEDTDEDGLPDWWERKYFGDLRYGADDDPDSDGYKNIVEFRRGMNPNAGVRRDSEGILKLKALIPGN